MYETGGGWDDSQGYDTFYDAALAASTCTGDWFHIVDLQAEQIILDSWEDGRSKADAEERVALQRKRIVYIKLPD